MLGIAVRGGIVVAVSVTGLMLGFAVALDRVFVWPWSY